MAERNRDGDHDDDSQIKTDTTHIISFTDAPISTSSRCCFSPATLMSAASESPSAARTAAATAAVTDSSLTALRAALATADEAEARAPALALELCCSCSISACVAASWALASSSSVRSAAFSRSALRAAADETGRNTRGACRRKTVERPKTEAAMRRTHVK